ncbi:hypothetical protein A3843_18785 [Pseudovibrio exalbescens]|uniref:Uncharacterized protein n=1 Tax=Pseudovibrio exalbescens TaxID=197461 RepID=A0A1U7JDB6_9HYPH|nr:hypothetical protein A3843_18785 [Pseudovibrio exalbescens]
MLFTFKFCLWERISDKSEKGEERCAAGAAYRMHKRYHSRLPSHCKSEGKQLAAARSQAQPMWINPAIWFDVEKLTRGAGQTLSAFL